MVMVSQPSCTAIVSTLLVAIALSSLILTQPTSPTHQLNLQDIYLLSVRNDDSTLGLDINLTISNSSDDRSLSTDHQQRTLFIANHTLSSQCGEDYFRCRNLFVESVRPVPGGDGEVHVVFVPLENGVLLLSIWYDLCTGELEWSTFIVDCPMCSPTVIYKADSNYYTVCVSGGNTDLSISVYELTLQLNGPKIGNGSSLSLHPLTSWTSESDSGTLNLSNIIVDVSHIENVKVYFAVGNNIYLMSINDTTYDTLVPPLLPGCDRIHRLVLNENDDHGSLTVYCTDRVMDFDPVYREWTAIHLISTYGIPFLCPNDSYKVRYNESENSLLLTRGSTPTLVINGVNISSGVCFETQHGVYFVYSDRQNDSYVYVHNFTSHNNYPISPYSCAGNRDCPQLLVKQNRFLIIQTAQDIVVFNTDVNFHLVINTRQEASLLTILSLNKTKTTPPAPLSRHTITSSPLLTTYHEISQETSLLTILSLNQTKAITTASRHTTTSSPMFTTYRDEISSLSAISTTIKSLSSMCTSYNNISMTQRSYASLTPFDNDTTTVLPYPAVNQYRVAILTGTFAAVAIIVIAASLIIGIYVRFHKKRYSTSQTSRPRLRFMTDSFPMIHLRHQDESTSITGSTDSDGQEDNNEQGDNSYELHPLFGKGWEKTTTV